MIGMDAGRRPAVAMARRMTAGTLRAQLRVLYLVPYLAGGGTERHLLDLIQTIRWSQPPWVIAPDGPSRLSVQETGARWIEVPVLGLERRSVAAWQDAYAHALAEFDPHLIHVHAGVELLWVTRRLAPERPRIFTVHGYAGSGAGLSYRLASLLGRRLAQKIIAVSRAEALRLGSLPQERLRIVPNGVADVRRTSAPLPLPGVPDGALVVAVASRLERPKGVDLVVEAFIQLVERGVQVDGTAGKSSEAHLVVMGTGSQECALRSRVAEAGLEGRIHLLGYQSQAARLLQRADIVVQASLQEAFGLSVVEAMAGGVPVIVSDAGGLPELVEDGVTGKVVPAGEVEPLVRALSELLADQEVRTAMGIAARDRYEQRFTLDRFAADTLAVYEEVAMQQAAS